jgi:phospholipid/cholesterol/gamma-HCH transport system substrate-binding protein
MARQLSWSDVRGGLIAAAVIVVVAVATLKYSRVGALRGDTFHVYALVGEARGVTPGSEVWLSGQKVGKITRIDFLPAATSDTSKRILIEMQVLSEYQSAMHANATAQIRAGGSFIGATVVYISPGNVSARRIADGDTLGTAPQGDLEAATAQLGSASQQIPAIMGNVKVLVAALRTTKGTAGAVMNGPGLGQLGDARIRAFRVVKRLQGGGTAGLVMQGGLTTRANRVMARADSVRALLASDNTSLGRFQRDSTLITQVADIRRELALVQQSLDEPRGTAGRVLRDSAITNAVADAQHEMTLLFADLKKHPFRYISF